MQFFASKPRRSSGTTHWRRRSAAGPRHPAAVRAGVRFRGRRPSRVFSRPAGRAKPGLQRPGLCANPILTVPPDNERILTAALRVTLLTRGQYASRKRSNRCRSGARRAADRRHFGAWGGCAKHASRRHHQHLRDTRRQRSRNDSDHRRNRRPWDDAQIDQNGKPDPNGHDTKVTLTKGTFEIDGKRAQYRVEQRVADPLQPGDVLGDALRNRHGHAARRNWSLQGHHWDGERHHHRGRAPPSLRDWEAQVHTHKNAKPIAIWGSVDGSGTVQFG